jgi:hypothetical protein
MESAITCSDQIESPIWQFVTFPDRGGDPNRIESLTPVALECSSLSDSHNPKFALILVLDGK